MSFFAYRDQQLHAETAPLSRIAAERIAVTHIDIGDFLGHDRELSVAEGDLVAIMSAGAYGMTMSSNYNTRPREAEAMVSGAEMHSICARESVAQLIARERPLR